MSSAEVVAVCRDDEHRFSKGVVKEIVLLTGLGVQGDAHAGVAVQHLSRVAAGPTQPNLRQVHLIADELLDELRAEGHDVNPGQLGENVTTRGLDLLALSRGTRLLLGKDAVVEVTGLRNPCVQIDAFRPGLLRRVLTRAPDGAVVRRAGIMGIVLLGGRVCPGDVVEVVASRGPHVPLERV